MRSVHNSFEMFVQTHSNARRDHTRHVLMPGIDSIKMSGLQNNILLLQSKSAGKFKRNFATSILLCPLHLGSGDNVSWRFCILSVVCFPLKMPSHCKHKLAMCRCYITIFNKFTRLLLIMICTIFFSYSKIFINGSLLQKAQSVCVLADPALTGCVVSSGLYVVQEI